MSATLPALSVGCAAVGDRPELSSCEVVDRDHGQVITSRYYLYETALATETAMRQCMANKGRWKAVAKGSEAYAKAEDEALARGPSLAMKTGVPECDAYFNAIMRCIEKLPDEARDGVRTSLVDSFTSWQMPESDPDTVKRMCAAALGAITESPVCR